MAEVGKRSASEAATIATGSAIGTYVGTTARGLITGFGLSTSGNHGIVGTGLLVIR